LEKNKEMENKKEEERRKEEEEKEKLATCQQKIDILQVGIDSLIDLPNLSLDQGPHLMTPNPGFNLGFTPTFVI
jgi:hypothetical protein